MRIVSFDLDDVEKISVTLDNAEVLIRFKRPSKASLLLRSVSDQPER